MSRRRIIEDASDAGIYYTLEVILKQGDRLCHRQRQLKMLYNSINWAMLLAFAFSASCARC